MHDSPSLGGTDRTAPPVWVLEHFQVTTDAWGEEDYELPHLLIGFFRRREQAEEARDRLLRRPGLRDWPRGFRFGWQLPDRDGAWETGFFADGDDDEAGADPLDLLQLPDATPSEVTHELWKVWHFQMPDRFAPPEPLSAKGIGSFSSAANAAAAIAHRRRQPGFRDWPQGFRCYRRRLGVVFGLDGFRERYGWDAWRDSIVGG